MSIRSPQYQSTDFNVLLLSWVEMSIMRKRLSCSSFASARLEVEDYTARKKMRFGVDVASKEVIVKAGLQDGKDTQKEQHTLSNSLLTLEYTYETGSIEWE